jgi:thymidylate synthase ThyX
MPDLSPYFSNLDRNVFALRNLSPTLAGALFSRYSRTDKSLREVFAEEFLGQAASAPPSSTPADEAAQAFFQRVLVGYGDDSVAELASAHLAAEGISMLAAKAIQDSRIGLSFLEKSTRYVRFDRRNASGHYPYHRGSELAGLKPYIQAADNLFDTYSALIDPLTAALRADHPRQPEEPVRAWEQATRASAFDWLRGLLPAGTLTNVGIFGNGRAFEYLIIKLAASELPECQALAQAFHQELGSVIPVFIARAYDERYGIPISSALQAMRAHLRTLVPRSPTAGSGGPQVRLLDCPPESEAVRALVAAALFPHSSLPLDSLPSLDFEAVFAELLASRPSRRHRLPRTFEHVSYTFELIADYGAFRDLHRHRMLTQDRQLLGIDLGWSVPEPLVRHGLQAPYSEAITSAQDAYRALEKSGVPPALLQYLVPMACRIRWYFKLSLRELVYLCELRTTAQAHPNYRHLAQQMWSQVVTAHPRLAACGTFIDFGGGDSLARRASEAAIDRKLAR